MSVFSKVIGIMVCIVGLLMWYLDYIVFTAIGALTAWIAGAMGMTGMAVFGLQIVGWILTFTIMLFLFVSGAYAIISGISMITITGD